MDTRVAGIRPGSVGSPTGACMYAPGRLQARVLTTVLSQGCSVTFAYHSPSHTWSLLMCEIGKQTAVFLSSFSLEIF